MSKKGTRALASATLMSLVLTTALSAGPVKAAAGQVTRIGEADRYATAASVATKNWTTSDNVVLVSGEGYADAVSASALAKKLDAPILLTSAGSLSTDTANALTQLKAKNIYIVGGNASVSQSVRDTLKASYTLVELGGANRYETNAAVAQKLVDLGAKADEVIMVGGEGFSDALSVAPVAAAKGQILLLGMNDANYMKPVIDFVKNNKSKVTVVGTKNVINDSILSAVNGTRVDGGSDRWDTNLKVLAAFKDSLKMDKLYVASASYNAKDDGYADALVASALAGKTASPLVLVDKEGAAGTNNAVAYIGKNASKKTDLNVVGGTGVVTAGVVDAINKAWDVKDTGDHTVQSIEAVSLNQFKVHYNSAVDSDSAEDVTNYKIDGTQLTQLDGNNKALDENGAVAKAIDDNTVLVTLAKPRKQHDNVTVSVKKSVLVMDKSTTVDAFDQTVEFKDLEQPTLKKVTVEGNSQITIEFSEAVNMKSLQKLKDYVKIDGKSISNFSVNSQYSEIKDHVEAPASLVGDTLSGIWANKVLFYFDSSLDTGNHTLKLSEGDTNGALVNAAGFTLKETSQDFTVDSVSTKPEPKTVEETKSGEVHITFDRAMDIQTAKTLSNYEINGKKLSDISGAVIKTDNDDTLIKLKHVGSAIKTGSNTLYIKNSVKDAYGNKVADDTRKNFDDVKDETKPKVDNLTIIDSETILVHFTKDVDFQYATNRSNYKLLDSKDIDITNHIKGIFSSVSDTDTGDTNTYKIKLSKTSPDGKEDWRLTGAKYTLTIKNIIDTASTPNTMEEFNQVISGTDTVAPKGTGIYAKLRGTGSKDKVVVYFSEAMDTATITNKDNYKFINGEGDTKTLPSDTNISGGGDGKSAVLEFPSSYHVVTGGKITSGTTNDVSAVIVTNVKDEAGNALDSVAYSNNDTIKKAADGAQIKANTLKVYYEDGGDDLKASVQFDRALDTIDPGDFRLGGVTPSSIRNNGDEAILTFKEDDLATDADKVKSGMSTVTYANNRVNSTPTKIDLVKAQGQDLKLVVDASVTTDETGALVSKDADLKSYDLKYTRDSYNQGYVYDYQAGPRTTCYDNNDDDANFWTAAIENGVGKVYVTFDTVLDSYSGVKSDDFTFTGAKGTDLKADSAIVDANHPNTVIFSFTKDLGSFTGKIDVKAKSTVNLRTKKDVNNNNAQYTPTADDVKTRRITVNTTSVARYLVDVAKANRTQANKDAALAAINALADSADKTALLNEANAIVIDGQTTVDVTGVTLDNTTASLVEGATQTLVATVAPTNATNKTVAWTSSNTAVATVDQTGKVTAVKAGTATITATAGTKTATCAVTVTAKSTQPTVTLGADSTTLLGFTFLKISYDGMKNTDVVTYDGQPATWSAKFACFAVKFNGTKTTADFDASKVKIN